MKLRNFLTRGSELQAPAIDRGRTWLNSEPLTPADLSGYVVAYQFWTYTCVNWLRTLPYVRAWADRYRPQGLVVIGVHTPEFSFEHEFDNVREGVRSNRITYPVVIDNDFSIWRAFDNNYWPALYVADAEGAIRHHQFGEGGYEQAERLIRQLLEDATGEGLPSDAVPVEPTGVEVAADWDDLASPESYLGLARGERFASEGDGSQGYVLPPELRLNHWGVAGAWRVRPESVTLDDGAGRIAYRFRARDVNLVMGATDGDVPFRVRIDGQPAVGASGADTDEQGNGTLSEPRLYQLVRQQGSIDEHTFEIHFAASGVGAYCFTFG